MQVEPYLFFSGNCEQAINFYAQCVGAKVIALDRYEGSPLEKQLPADWKNRVMHAQLQLPSGDRILASDRMPGQPFAGHAGFAISLDCKEGEERANEVFASLGQGGMVIMPMAMTFWGSYFGMLVDRFGITWMLRCDCAQEKSPSAQIS